jgi:hypothetical protein
MQSSYLKIQKKFFTSTNEIMDSNIESCIPRFTSLRIKNKQRCKTTTFDPIETDETLDEPQQQKNIISKYLEDNPLHRCFELFNENQQEPFTVYICIAQITENGLEFLMEKSNSGLSFPLFSYECPELPENQDKEDEYSQETTHFSNTCLQYAMDILHVEVHENEIEWSSFYRGFLPFTENILFVVFDSTPFYSFLRPRISNIQRCEEEGKKWWGSISNIVIEKSINRLPIDPNISDFFIKYPFLQKL